MSLRKRGGIWWIDVRYSQRRASTPHYWDCQQSPSAGISRPIQIRAVANRQIGRKPRRTWNEAVVRWLKESSPQGDARDG